MLLLDPLIIGNGVMLHISRVPALFQLFVSCKDTYKQGLDELMLLEVKCKEIFWILS